MDSIVMGGGCFWCTEAAFKQLEGAESVISGYSGGETENPSYREVCSGETGHAEVVKVEFNEKETSLEELLDFFFRIHDPTTEDREGPDVGSQYRSIILYNSQNQKKVADKFIQEKKGEYTDEIVTEVEELEEFYGAEEKHQDYFEKNPKDAYCTMHAQPKVEKAEKFSG
jgi:peptide-methionine (S)-S-oxide reductase